MTFSARTPALGALLLGIAASSAAGQSLLQQYGEVVMASGDAVAGLPGVTIDVSGNTGIPVIDLNGNLVWRAKLAGAVTTNTDDQAVFYGRTGNDYLMLLRRGDAAPSLGAGVLLNYSSTQWDNPRISAENDFVLIGSTLVQGSGGVTSADDTCVFWGVPGGLLVLAREGDAAPGLPGATLTGTISGSNTQTALNSSGTAVIKAKAVGGPVTGTSDDDGWLIGTPGNLQWMYREADPIGVVAVGSITFDTPQIDEVGRVIVSQTLSTTIGTTPATSADDTTILLYTPGSGMSILAREGDPAPGPGGCFYGSFASGTSDQGISRTSGRVVFMNTMTGGDVVGSSNDGALFAGTIGGSFTRIAREGEAAPTGVPGEIYQALFPNGRYQINENGYVVFVAQLGPTGLDVYSDVAVFRAKPPYGPTDVEMVLREGQAVDLLPAGWTIGNTSGGGMSSSATSPMLNERGDVMVAVAGVGDNTQPNWGVPAVIKWDELHPNGRAVWVQGDTFATQTNPTWVSSGTLGMHVKGSGDGGNLSWNNNGDFCVKMFSGSQNGIVRGHACSMISEPASVPAAGGVPQNFHIDAGVSQAFRFYVVLATSLGSRPGFVGPFGPQNIPLNPDPLWTDLSLSAANSSIWINTIGVTDANGVGVGPAGFVMPPGFPGFLGTTLHHAAALLDFSLVQTHVTEPSSLRLY